MISLNLTPREWSIVELMQVAKSSKQIAREFGISVKTVEVHKSRMYQKTNCHSAIEFLLKVSSMRPAKRLPAEIHKVRLQTSDNGEHEIDVSLVKDLNGQPVELVFVGRGKIGHGIDLMLTNLGIAVSRILQDRDPNSGQDIDRG